LPQDAPPGATTSGRFKGVAPGAIKMLYDDGQTTHDATCRRKNKHVRSRNADVGPATKLRLPNDEIKTSVGNNCSEYISRFFRAVERELK
jgi:hypothetical protein